MVVSAMAFDSPALRHSLGVLRLSQATRHYQEGVRAWPERKRIWPLGCVTGTAPGTGLKPDGTARCGDRHLTHPLTTFLAPLV